MRQAIVILACCGNGRNQDVCTYCPLIIEEWGQMARLLRLRSSIGQITCIFRLLAKKRFFPHWIHFGGRNVTCGNKLLHWLGKHTFILVIYVREQIAPQMQFMWIYLIPDWEDIHSHCHWLHSWEQISRLYHPVPPRKQDWAPASSPTVSVPMGPLSLAQLFHNYKYTHILIQMPVSKDLISLPQRFFC